MSRVVLLGLGDQDVDVLTRISTLKPRPEVLVMHPDPGALIMRLAALAELTIVHELPDPRADDLVVISGTEEEPVHLVEPWRMVGARIVASGSLRTRDVTRAAPVPRVVNDPKAGQWTEIQEDSVLEPQKPGSGISKPNDLTSPTQSLEGTSPSSSAATVSAPAAPSPAVPAAEIWERPEATFRHLVREAVGETRAVTLWWDGETDVWIPWVWTGDVPQGTAAEAESGHEVPSVWGRFRLVGAEDRRDRLNMAALARVAEDMILRDLATWRRTAETLRSRRAPGADAGETSLKAWAEPVLAALNAPAALIWRRTAEGWRLLTTRGEGLAFAGDLQLAEDLFSATFERRGSPWHSWDPVEGIRVHLNVEEKDPHWPLRLRRVELALSGAEG